MYLGVNKKYVTAFVLILILAYFLIDHLLLLIFFEVFLFLMFVLKFLVSKIFISENGIKFGFEKTTLWTQIQTVYVQTSGIDCELCFQTQHGVKRIFFNKEKIREYVNANALHIPGHIKKELDNIWND